jgi:hypothetical protein
MSIEAIEAVVDLIEMGGVVGQEDIVKCLRSAIEQAEKQEPVAWGVDWGKAGDIPCVSIIKRLADGGIEVVAVEYAPYAYTAPPQRQPLTDEQLKPIADEYRILFGGWVVDFARAIERAAIAAAKEKS